MRERPSWARARWLRATEKTGPGSKLSAMSSTRAACRVGLTLRPDHAVSRASLGAQPHAVPLTRPRTCPGDGTVFGPAQTPNCTDRGAAADGRDAPRNGPAASRARLPTSAQPAPVASPYQRRGRLSRLTPGRRFTNLGHSRSRAVTRLASEVSELVVTDGKLPCYRLEMSRSIALSGPL
jgi:hypothetical protein